MTAYRNTFHTLTSGTEVWLDDKGVASFDIEQGWDEGPTCNICDASGHGYPGGGPCPLEQGGPDDGFDEWERSRGVRDLDPQWG